VNKLGEKGSIN